jgi:hypothetical protein
MDTFNTYVAPVAGVVAAFIVGFAAKYGLTLDATQVSGLMIAGFVLVEKIIAAKTNPTGAVTPAALRASRVMLAQHGEPSMATGIRAAASKAGPVRRDD